MTRTKVCERCGHSYPATFAYFGDNGRYSDGLALHCRACRTALAAERKQRKNERSKAWAQANRDKVRESARQSYQNTRRDRLAYMRRYRAANKENLNAYQREYRQRSRYSE
jgi:hypothetical protein